MITVDSLKILQLPNNTCGHTKCALNKQFTYSNQGKILFMMELLKESHAGLTLKLQPYAYSLAMYIASSLLITTNYIAIVCSYRAMQIWRS